MAECPTNWGRLHYRVDGPVEAPALVLSNSLAADLSMWDAQVAHWGSRFRVVRYDQRGHGGSSAPSGSYTIAMLGEDVLTLMDHLGIGRADWCGISMGGMTGLWLAAHAPERIGRLVLANTAVRMAPPELWNGRIAVAHGQGMDVIAGATVERWFPESFRRAAPTTVGRVRSVIAATPVAGYAGCCAAIRDLDLGALLNDVRHPTLVIVGERDISTPPAAGELIHAGIAGARLARLDAAHLSAVERAEEFAALVETFLGEDRAVG